MSGNAFCGAGPILELERCQNDEMLPHVDPSPRTPGRSLGAVMSVKMGQDYHIWLGVYFDVVS